MAWTETTRRQYRRDGLRYASNLTDAEWALIEPLLPPPAPVGRPRRTDLRRVAEAILYMASTGCQWRQIPREFPPYSTVQGYFYGWSRDGTFAQINHVLQGIGVYFSSGDSGDEVAALGRDRVDVVAER